MHRSNEYDESEGRRSNVLREQRKTHRGGDGTRVELLKRSSVLLVVEEQRERERESSRKVLVMRPRSSTHMTSNNKRASLQRCGFAPFWSSTSMDLIPLPRTGGSMHEERTVSSLDVGETTIAARLPALCSGVSLFSLTALMSILWFWTRKRTTSSWSLRHAWWSPLRPFWSTICVDAPARSSSWMHASFPV